MSTVSPPTPASPALSLKPRVASDREKLAGAAKQFEAIFIRQMLASARATNFGGNDLFGQMDQTFVQMRDERFAEIASDTGAFGLARQIENHLAALLPANAANPAKGK